MTPLPLPIRVAAGLVATAVEQARDLPRLAIEFPVTAISHTLQASMRMQQKVTELAIKGDRALGLLRTPEDTPAWATFDDDEPSVRTAPAGTTDAASSRAAATAGDATGSVTALRKPPTRPTPRPATRRTAPPASASAAASSVPLDPGSAEPDVLPGYREMTIPQLRARLRKLSVDDLRTLLDWEIAHDNRPPFVTMLGNRITTVTES